MSEITGIYVIVGFMCAVATFNIIRSLIDIWGGGYERREVMEKKRVERKRRQRIDTQTNIGRRIVNALRDNFENKLKVIGFDVIVDGGTIFKITVVRYEKGVRETIIAINVDANVTEYVPAGNGSISIEKFGIGSSVYPINEENVEVVIREASQFLREIT
jgi:hypothetical protein